VLAIDAFARLRPIEEALMRVPPSRHRDALAELGVPLTRETYGTATPRRGVMQI
jgi:hypothetical protein